MHTTNVASMKMSNDLLTREMIKNMGRVRECETVTIVKVTREIAEDVSVETATA